LDNFFLTARIVLSERDPAVEATSAGLHKAQHTIIVRRRNAVESDPDIELDLVDDETFKKGLIEMGVSEDDVRALSLASGQSLTILRRRLSDVPAIKFPPWAEDTALTRKLIPLGFAGAWDSQSKEDQEILSCLTGDKYQPIEKSVADLLQLEHSPVWSVGRSICRKTNATPAASTAKPATIRPHCARACARRLCC
jgi:hypothetical protein